VRTLLIPFAIGFAVLALLELIAVFSLNLAATRNAWASFDVHVGPVLLFAYERSAHISAVTFGSGLLLVALVGGVLNAAGAALLQRRV
jgi:hypothetical protein